MTYGFTGFHAREGVAPLKRRAIVKALAESAVFPRS